MVRGWERQNVAARRSQVLAGLLARLLSASGVDDAEPVSMSGVGSATGIEFFITSRSRGRLSIGVLPYNHVRAALAEVMPLSRPKAAAAASEALTRRTARRVRRTAELTAEGKTAREIGELIASEEGVERYSRESVKQWRRQGKTSTR